MDAQKLSDESVGNLGEATVRRLPSMLPDGNRRQAARYAVELDVTIASDHNFYAGFIENLSAGGVFMATHIIKPVGETMDIVVNLPNRDEPVRARGEVRWVREFNEFSNVPPGLGLRFVEISSDDVAAIAGFLEQRDPMFFDDDDD